MNCKHPRCLRDATVLAKIVGIRGSHRVELLTEIITCDEHVPNNRQIGQRMKNFVRSKFPGGRLANMFVVFGVQSVPLTSEEAADHLRARPNPPA